MKGKAKKESLVLGPLLKKLGSRIGAKVLLEPSWGIAGQITFKNGRRSYFRYNTLDLNPVGASDIAKDKDYAAFFMRTMQYPIVEGEAFYSDAWAKTIGSKRGVDAAYRYARRLGFPVIVKPNSGSQGVGVSLAHDKAGFYRAIRSVFRSDRIALVQRVAKGRDYRIVVLDTEVISAYERTPLAITGNGRSTVRQLLAAKQRSFEDHKRDTKINLKDRRIQSNLMRKKMTMDSVVPEDEHVLLLDNANLSSGGDAIDVTHSIHPGFKKIAVALTRDMGLRLAGVDLMIDGDISQRPGKYVVLEINAAPGLDHYVKTGAAQRRIVEDLYMKVLRSLAARR